MVIVLRRCNFYNHHCSSFLRTVCYHLIRNMTCLDESTSSLMSPVSRHNSVPSRIRIQRNLRNLLLHKKIRLQGWSDGIVGTHRGFRFSRGKWRALETFLLVEMTRLSKQRIQKQRGVSRCRSCFSAGDPSARHREFHADLQNRTPSVPERVRPTRWKSRGVARRRFNTPDRSRIR